MRRKIVFFALFLLLASLVSAEEIVVGVKEARPFVIVEEGKLSGFSIDLMNILEERMPGTKIRYHFDKDLTTHLEAVERGEVDLGIAATTITSLRSERLDFSHPFFESSLGIMYLKANEKRNISHTFFTPQVLFIGLLVLLYVLICGHIIWFIEKDGGHFDKHYLNGVAKGMWWTIVTMSTVGYGDIYPTKPAGKTFAAVVIISGISLFGVALAVLSSSLTLDQLTPAIEGPEDLIGKNVVVLEGTTSQSIAESKGMHVIPVSTIDEAANFLRSENAVAFIYDTPILQYYILTDQTGSFTLAEQTFIPSPYGIAFPKNSDTREKINTALLEVIEDGTHESLQLKWFGRAI